MGSVARGCLPPLTTECRTCSSAQREMNRRARRSSPDDWIDESRINSKHDTSAWSLTGDDDALSDLHTKLAHIQWRKHDNNTKIRKTINTSKQLHERDLLLQLSVDREGERERWTEAIVRDELARPAEISETFLKDWEQREDANRKRQLKETKLHLRSIKRVENAIKSKRETGTTAKVQPKQGEDGMQQQQHPSGVEDTTNALKAKLKMLQNGVKQTRRELRRAAKQADLRGSFSATSFKTGRGRW